MKSAIALAAALSLTLLCPSLPARGPGGGMGGGRGFVPPAGAQNAKSTVQIVAKDQLAPKETDGLKDQMDALQKASDALTGDAKLSNDQVDQVQAVFDAASFFIWSKGLDDDGKVVSRYGNTVFPVAELAKLFEDHNLTAAQGKTLLAAARALAAAKLRLNQDLAQDVRVSLQKEFNAGLAKYYIAK